MISIENADTQELIDEPELRGVYVRYSEPEDSLDSYSDAELFTELQYRGVLDYDELVKVVQEHRCGKPEAAEKLVRLCYDAVGKIC